MLKMAQNSILSFLKKKPLKSEALASHSPTTTEDQKDVGAFSCLFLSPAISQPWKGALEVISLCCCLYAEHHR